MDLERIVLLTLVFLWAGASLWSRIAGGLVGGLAAALVGVWGYWMMEYAGREIFLFGLPRPLYPAQFYTAVSLLVCINGLTAVHGWQLRRARKLLSRP